MILCNCGCCNEIIIKPHHKYYGIPKYIRGHFIRTNELKLNVSKTHKNKVLSEETKQKMSKVKSGKNHPNYGKHWKLKDETKIKQSIVKCKENNPNWKGGITNNPYCEKWNEKLREEIRNKYNRKCYLCGKDEKDNITKNNKQWRLSVHHIDSDKEQGCNGKQWKLIPLCLHCHGKIYFYNIK